MAKLKSKPIVGDFKLKPGEAPLDFTQSKLDGKSLPPDDPCFVDKSKVTRKYLQKIAEARPLKNYTKSEETAPAEHVEQQTNRRKNSDKSHSK